MVLATSAVLCLGVRHTGNCLTMSIYKVKP